MSEADANEADVVEQLQPVGGDEPDPTRAGSGEPFPAEAEVTDVLEQGHPVRDAGTAALPLEAEPADVLEQGHALPDDGDDYPRPQDAEDDRA